MSSSPESGSPYTRRILWLSMLVIAAGAIYTGIWYYCAQLLEERVETTLTRLNGDGVRAHCEEPEIHGYPFRLGVRCRSVFYEDVKEGVSFRAEATETAANIYAPKHVVMNVKSPATVFLPFLAPIDMRWEAFNVSAQLDSPLPLRASAAGTNIQILPEDEPNSPIAVLSGGELHARQVEEDVEVAATFRELRLGPTVATNVPSLEGRALVIVNDGRSMLVDRNISLRGHRGVIEEMVIGVVGEAASVSLSGPVEFDAEGLMTGQLRIKVDDPVGTSRVLAQIFPDEAEHIRSATGMLTALGNAPVELRVVRGNIFLGFIPLGKMPPV